MHCKSSDKLNLRSFYNYYNHKKRESDYTLRVS
nr:MAG TPA: hypothetical protein [Caudoviricetes sp.]